MGKRLTEITPELEKFITDQKIFFVGTAMAEGRINVSPKGMDTLRVLGPNQLIWLNLTGSGNETAAHLGVNDRMTVMFCAFEGKPLILRLYGQAQILEEGSPGFSDQLKKFPPIIGARQVVDMHVDLVQSSCGFGVPLMDFREERSQLTAWAAHKGEEGLKAYRKEKNTISLDGHKIG